MSNKQGGIGRCGACRFYTPVGRRGGDCSQLSVPVQSDWKTCCLAESPFQKLAKVSDSDINLTKVAVTETVVSQALPMPTGRFLATEKQPTPKLASQNLS